MLHVFFRHPETLCRTCEHREGKLRIKCACLWSELPIHFLSLFFPQLRADIHATPLAKSQASPRIRVHFHQSTALITTTSFIALFLSDCFCESLCGCENPDSFGSRDRRRKSSDRCISTAEKPPAHFILRGKASTVRQRLIQRGKAT